MDENRYKLLTGKVVVTAPITMSDERAEELLGMIKPDVADGLKALARRLNDDVASAGLDVTSGTE